MPIRVRDNITGFNGTIVHYYQPTYATPNPGPGGYAAPAATALTAVLIRYDNLTLGIQTLNNLSPI